MFSNLVIIAKRQIFFKCLCIYFYMSGYFFSVCLSMHFILSDHKEQKRMLDPPRRGLTDSSRVLDPRSSVRAKSVFNY